MSLEDAILKLADAIRYAADKAHATPTTKDKPAPKESTGGAAGTPNAAVGASPSPAPAPAKTPVPKPAAAPAPAETTAAPKPVKYEDVVSAFQSCAAAGGTNARGVALEMLKLFNVARTQDLPADQHGAFIEACAKKKVALMEATGG